MNNAPGKPMPAMPLSRRAACRPCARPPTRLASGLLALSMAMAGCQQKSGQDFVRTGQDYLKAGKDAAAVIEFKNAIQTGDDKGETRYLLGVALARSAQWASAEIELRKALALGQSPSQVIPALASVLIDSGAPAKALADIDSLTDASGSAKAELLALRGDALAGLGKKNESREAYRAALAADPRSGRAAVGMARWSALDGDLPGANSAVDAALQADPGLYDGWLTKANVETRLKHRPEAIKAWVKALELRKADYRPYLGLIPLLAEASDLAGAKTRVAELKELLPGSWLVSYMNALIAATAGDRKTARDAIQDAMKGAPDDTRVLRLAGLLDYELGNFASALAPLGRLVVLLPDESVPRKMLATCHLQLGNAVKAREVLGPLLNRKTVDAGTLAIAGRVEATAGNGRKAVDYMERARAADPNDLATRLYLGQARIAAGDFEQGISDLRQVAAADKRTGLADIGLVQVFLARGNPSGALEAANNLVAKLPREAPSHNAVGMVRVVMKDSAGARAAFEQALKLDPGFFPATRSLSVLDVQEGKGTRAVERLRDAIAKDPSRDEAAVMLAELLLKQRAALAEAIPVLDSAIAANPTSVRLRLAKVQYLMQTGNAKQAVEAAQAAQTVLPEEKAIVLVLARAQQAAGDLDQAASNYGKFATLSPGSVAPLLGRVDILASQKNWAGARDLLQEAIRKTPDNLTARIALISVYLRWDQPEQALAEARAIQARWPRRPEGYLAEANVLVRAKDVKGMEAILRTGLSQADAPELSLKLLGLLFGQKRFDAVEQEASAWLKKHPGDIPYITFVGDAFVGADRLDKAQVWYRTGLDRAPGNAQIMNNLAWVLLKNNDPGALPMATKAAALLPEEADVLDTLAMAQLASGQAREAVATLVKAVQLKPENASVQLNLARAYLKAGDEKNALAALSESEKHAREDTVKKEIADFRASLGR
ncbi:MAG: XrtA/PEP-CTERM system TPR-repeat protein PrsT [Betaproteobacteria bacterium]